MPSGVIYCHLSGRCREFFQRWSHLCCLCRLAVLRFAGKGCLNVAKTYSLAEHRIHENSSQKHWVVGGGAVARRLPYQSGPRRMGRWIWLLSGTELDVRHLPWHAAGLLPYFNMVPLPTTALHDYFDFQVL